MEQRISFIFTDIQKFRLHFGLVFCRRIRQGFCQCSLRLRHVQYHLLCPQRIGCDCQPFKNLLRVIFQYFQQHLVCVCVVQRSDSRKIRSLLHVFRKGRVEMGGKGAGMDSGFLDLKRRDLFQHIFPAHCFCMFQSTHHSTPPYSLKNRPTGSVWKSSGAGRTAGSALPPHRYPRRRSHGQTN